MPWHASPSALLIQADKPIWKRVVSSSDDRRLISLLFSRLRNEVLASPTVFTVDPQQNSSSGLRSAVFLLFLFYIYVVTRRPRASIDTLRELDPPLDEFKRTFSRWRKEGSMYAWLATKLRLSSPVLLRISVRIVFYLFSRMSLSLHPPPPPPPNRPPHRPPPGAPGAAPTAANKRSRPRGGDQGCTKGGEETKPLKRRGTNRMRSQPAAGSSLTASRAASACSCGLMKSSSSPCLGLHQIVAKPRLCAFSTRARRFTCGSDRTCFLGHAPPAANTVSVPPWFGADTAASPCTKPFPNDQVAFTHHHMVVC